MVLILSGLNFAGYLAHRAIGSRRGYGVAGALGGLVSSTAVTLTFARRSRGGDAPATSLAGGVIAACTVPIPRVLVVSAIGVYGLAATLGLTDVDALALSFSSASSGLEPSIAARGIAIGILANTLFKLLLTLVIGRSMFRVASALSLLGLAVLTALALVFL